MTMETPIYKIYHTDSYISFSLGVLAATLGCRNI